MKTKRKTDAAEPIYVADRRKCATCKYRMRMDNVVGYDDRPKDGSKRYCCNYLSIMRHSRLTGGIDPEYCDKYEYGRSVRSEERWNNEDMTIVQKKDEYEVYKASRIGRRRGQL
jgi:hypothetical protein